MKNTQNTENSGEPAVTGRARSLQNLKPFSKGSDERCELARAASRPAMQIGPALKKMLARRVPKSWVKDLFVPKDWELMNRLLSGRPRLGDILVARMAVGAMTDSKVLEILLNRTEGKVTQQVASAFGAVIRVELPPEAIKGPPPDVLDIEFKPGMVMEGEGDGEWESGASPAC